MAPRRDDDVLVGQLPPVDVRDLSLVRLRHAAKLRGPSLDQLDSRILEIHSDCRGIVRGGARQGARGPRRPGPTDDRRRARGLGPQPAELLARTGLTSNLLTYHLDVLEDAGIVARCQSSGDGRRRYVCLRRSALPELPSPGLGQQPALFVCSQNSARSQLAAAIWQHETGESGTSAGTHPAACVHPGAVAAASRAGLDLTGARPRHLTDVVERPELVVTVCDRAREELSTADDWVHWSVPDPVEAGTRRAFDVCGRRPS